MQKPKKKEKSKNKEKKEVWPDNELDWIFWEMFLGPYWAIEKAEITRQSDEYLNRK